MRKFTISIGPRHAPRHQFEVTAEDAQRAGEQADGLAELGERVDVAPIPTEDELLEADLQRMLTQRQRDQRRVAEVAALEQSYFTRAGWLL